MVGPGRQRCWAPEGGQWGGGADDAEDDGEIDELGVAAEPLVEERCRTVHVVAAATTTIAPAAAGISHRRRGPACCVVGADVGGDDAGLAAVLRSILASAVGADGVGWGSAPGLVGQARAKSVHRA